MSNDTFQWTNELLYEWGVFYMKDLTRKPYDKLIEAFKQSKMPKREEPALGIMPMWLHNEQRLDELNKAISRYDRANLAIPKEWISEKESLAAYCKGRLKELVKQNQKSPLYYHTPPYPEKEWEIVSYMPPSNHPIPATNTLVDLYDFPIHSVRRLSDNEVFTAGDVNEYPTGLQETIKEFRVNESNSGMMLFRTDNVWSNLSLAKKPQPKKERIEVEFLDWKCEGPMGWDRFFRATKEVSNEKLPQLKAAIERVLNDEGGNAQYSLSLVKEKLEISISDPELMPKKVVVNGFEYIIR